jgi:hypothetical protein
MENMGSVRRAVAVEIESPPPELYAVAEAYRRIVEEVAAYVAERGRLEREKYSELYGVSGSCIRGCIRSSSSRP